MPNHKSAEKRARQNVTRRARNRFVVASLRTEIKKVRAAIEANNTEDATAFLPRAMRALSRAANKGVIHKRQAQRRIGRLTQAVNKLTRKAS